MFIPDFEQDSSVRSNGNNEAIIQRTTRASLIHQLREESGNDLIRSACEIENEDILVMSKGSHEARVRGYSPANTTTPQSEQALNASVYMVHWEIWREKVETNVREVFHFEGISNHGDSKHYERRERDDEVSMESRAARGRRKGNEPELDRGSSTSTRRGVVLNTRRR